MYGPSFLQLLPGFKPRVGDLYAVNVVPGCEQAAN
jgi:hypothetical protein